MHGCLHSMADSEYLRPQPLFEEAGAYEALAVGNAKWTNGRSAAAVLIWPKDRPEAAKANWKPSAGFESDNWRADIGAIVVAIALTPNDSKLVIYTANEDLADRADRLFNDDASALLRTNGRPIANAEGLIRGDEDRRARSIFVRVVYWPADSEPFKSRRKELLAANRKAMAS